MSIFGWKKNGYRRQLTDLVVSIDGGEFPQGVRDSHSAVIRLKVQEVPFLPSLYFANIGLVGEAVQLHVTLCKTQYWVTARVWRAKPPVCTS